MYFYQTSIELLERQVRTAEDGSRELRVIAYSLEKLMERNETAMDARDDWVEQRWVWVVRGLFRIIYTKKI